MRDRRPVFDVSSAPIGAIGLVVPSANWPVDPATSDAVRDAARHLKRTRRHVLAASPQLNRRADGRG